MQTGAYLKPQPVPPRTIAATRIAPAMDPMMRLVALGPVWASVGKRDMSFDFFRAQNICSSKTDGVLKDPEFYGMFDVCYFNSGTGFFQKYCIHIFGLINKKYLNIHLIIVQKFGVWKIF